MVEQGHDAADAVDDGDDDGIAGGDEGLQPRADLGVVVATRMLALMGIEAEAIRGAVDGDAVLIEIEGLGVEDGALDGRALESLQFLLNKAVHRSGGRRSRLHLRVDGFRSRRREPLERVAGALAQKAQRLGRVITLGPLEANDLRAWTTALQRQSGTQLATVGPNEARRLVLAPEGAEPDTGSRSRRRRRRKRRNG